MSVMALNAGPSLCGRPHEPVYAEPSAWNFGSPRPDSLSSKDPEGLLVCCNLNCRSAYASRMVERLAERADDGSEEE
jgi:hypothetical protein